MLLKISEEEYESSDSTLLDPLLIKLREDLEALGFQLDLSIGPSRSTSIRFGDPDYPVKVAKSFLDQESKSLARG